MTTMGVMVLAATVAILVAAFWKRRTRPFPGYGYIGLAALTAGEILMFRGVEPVATYFTPIAWTAYLSIADAAVFAIRGNSPLNGARRRLAQTALLSIPLWLIFEGYNLRLSNWTYVGLAASLPARWFGYAWSFATITPAIFMTADLIESFGWWRAAARPMHWPDRAGKIWVASGAILLISPLLVPRPASSYLFGCVWLGFIFLLDPINFRLGLPSLTGDLVKGRRSRLFSLLAAGWVCGWLWEFWNYWAAAKWHYIFPIWQTKKIFEMPIPGYAGFLPFALECFVMYEFAAWLLGWIKPASDTHDEPGEHSARPGAASITFSMRPAIVTAVIPAMLLASALFPAGVRASGLALPAVAKEGLDLLYSGRTEEAIARFQQVQKDAPDNPLGFLLEADARWWQIYCEACEIKWNMIDAWKGTRNAETKAYLALTDKATQLADARIAAGDSAEMELYSGMGWMLRARLMGLLDARRGTAQAGIQARAHLLRCLALDPQMSDAYTGLGLYNYYVDTLSALAKILRFFMGIPGGDKRDGIRQLHMAMEQGVLTRVEARYYLAKNLRNYDLDYAASVDLMTPLVTQYPNNPFFRLLLGDDQAKLGRNGPAAASFRVAEQVPLADSACAQRIRAVADQSLAKLSSTP